MSSNWKDYIRGKEEMVYGLPLFPLADSDHPPIEEMERDRFRWLAQAYPDKPENLFLLWKDNTFLMDERRAMGKISLEDFYSRSVGLGLLLLLKEVRNLPYLVALRDCLSLRLKERETVYYVGPTSGAELEAIHDAGGSPILVSSEVDSKWQQMAETRLFESRIPFESFDFDTAYRNPYGTRHVVLSSWAPNPSEYVELAVSSLGTVGFIYCFATILGMEYELQVRKLRRLDLFQNQVIVCFKYPTTKEIHNVCY